MMIEWDLPEWARLVYPWTRHHALLGVVEHHGVVDEADPAADISGGVA